VRKRAAGDGFVAHYLVKVIYPPGLTHGMQIGLGVLLVLVAIIGYWRFLCRRRRGVARALADEGSAGTRGHDRHPRAVRP
jgi:hypothetical protein